MIYACSGCSSAAQLANHLALRAERTGDAEMSCIAWLGGDVKPLVRLAKSGRPNIMLDGCPLACGRHTLARHGLTPDLHWDLSRMGAAKENHVDFQANTSNRFSQPKLNILLPPPAHESSFPSLSMAARQVIDAAQWFSIVTSGPNGPHLADCWTRNILKLGYLEHEIIVPVWRMERTGENLRRDPRVELLFVADSIQRNKGSDILTYPPIIKDA